MCHSVSPRPTSCLRASCVILCLLVPPHVSACHVSFCAYTSNSSVHLVPPHVSARHVSFCVSSSHLMSPRVMYHSVHIRRIPVYTSSHLMSPTIRVMCHSVASPTYVELPLCTANGGSSLCDENRPAKKVQHFRINMLCCKGRRYGASDEKSVLTCHKEEKYDWTTQKVT